MTLLDPTRRVYVRIAALEASDGPGLPVLTADGQVGLAYMSSLELKGLSEEATRLSHGVVLQIAANLAGGIHMLRIGDGAHQPNPRDKTIGLCTAWAVFRGAWLLHNRRGRNDPLHWQDPGAAAYGGCLGPGLNVDSGEVSASIACLREAVGARKTWAKSLVDFNTAYGTDSASCAHDLERAYRAGELAAVADSAIAGLVETWLHLRTELDSLGGTFVMFKLPGHGGVYPMAAADACAKACLALHPSAVKLDIRSTLGYVEAVPRNPATLETGATAAGWRRWAGQPSPLAAGTRYFRLLKARLQDSR